MQQQLGVALKSIEWDSILHNNVEENSNVFLSRVDEVLPSLSRRGSTRTKKEHVLPWLDNNCRQLMKNRDILLKKEFEIWFVH